MTVIRTAEEIRARLDEGRAQHEAGVENETFAAAVVRVARAHEALVDQLHAAADLIGVSHDEADALLVDEIEAGPVVR
jgi:hypothetical protein